MANFRVQIENLAGKSSFNSAQEETDYTAMLDNFLLQSARNVLDVLDDSYINQNNIVVSITDSSGYNVTNLKISKVLRNGVGCVEVPLEMESKLELNSKSIYEPTKNSPVYYIKGQTATGAKIFIKPTPTNSEPGEIFFLSIPSSVPNTGSTISNFPDQAEYAVVLGSAVRLLQHKLNNLLHEDEDVELAQVVQQEMAILNQMYMVELNQLNGGGINIQGQEGE
jgi:hypothetical protein